MDHVYNSKVARMSIISIIPYSGAEHKADEKEETKVNMGQSDQIEGGDREEVQGDGSTPLCICCVVFLMLSIVSVIVLGIVSTGWYLVTL